jgi:hypothetical protein
MMLEMQRQKEDLSKSLENMSRSIAMQPATTSQAAVTIAPVRNSPRALPVTEINNLQLPRDIMKWRTLHVQAWLAFTMELPEYTAAFKKNSVNGLVLAKCITEDHLQDQLGVVNELHREKLLYGIHELQAQLELTENEAKRKQIEAEKKHRAEEKRKAELEEMARKARDKRLKKGLAKAKKDKKRSDSPSKKKSSKGKAKYSTMPTNVMFGEVRERNGLDRVRIARDMRAYRDSQNQLQAKRSRQNATWAFEYTDGVKPSISQGDDLWNSYSGGGADADVAKSGTAGYRRAMSSSLLKSKEFSSSNALGSFRSAPLKRRISTVPVTCSPDEVLALVKGGMFQLSEWLLEVESAAIRRRKILDSDLSSEGEGGDDDCDSEGDVFHLLDDTDDGNNDRNEGMNRDWDAQEYGNDDGDDDDEDDDNDLLPPPFFDSAEDGYDDLADLTHRGEEDGYGCGDGRGGGERKWDDDYRGDGSIASFGKLNGGDEGIPPSYESLQGNQPSDPRQQSERRTGMGKKHQSQSHRKSIPGQYLSPEDEEHVAIECAKLDRLELLFGAFVNRKNNGARWLGENEKLTRLKFHGGVEKLLRLKMEWPQFDAMWTKLDFRRSGELDMGEFKEVFGDVANFRDFEGAGTLSAYVGSEPMRVLSKTLFELCDALRHAGFTIREMFNGFDRNGSGEVSVAEFCSMLRLILGNTFEKRLIYRSLSVLDTDGNKSISQQEVLVFVYRVWRSQLDELARKLSTIDETLVGEEDAKKQSSRIVRERADLKEAIKRNFPREWRDRLERAGMGGHAIPGPVTSLLQRMGLQEATGTATVKNTATTFSPERGGGFGGSAGGKSADFGRSMSPYSSSHGNTYGSAQKVPPQYRPASASMTSPGQYRQPISNGNTSTSLLNATGYSKAFTSSPPRPTSATASYGQNQLIRFRVKVPASSLPAERHGASLSLPPGKSLYNPQLHSGEATATMLRQSEPVGVRLYATSNL